ncbi:MAG: hypothetical protein ACYCTV_01545 [Leptospirales bacterium]
MLRYNPEEKEGTIGHLTSDRVEGCFLMKKSEQELKEVQKGLLRPVLLEVLEE